MSQHLSMESKDKAMNGENDENGSIAKAPCTRQAWMSQKERGNIYFPELVPQ